VNLFQKFYYYQRKYCYILTIFSVGVSIRIRTPPKTKLHRTMQQGLCPPIRAELMRSHSNTSTKTNRSGRRTRTPVKSGTSPVVTIGGVSGDTTAATSDSEHCLVTENHLDQLNKSSTTL